MKWNEMMKSEEREANMVEIALEVWSVLHAKFMISDRRDGLLTQDPPLYQLCWDNVLGHIFWGQILNSFTKR